MTTSPTTGQLRALSVAFPSVVRTNDYFRVRQPELVARAEEHSLAKLWGSRDSTPASRFERAMTPYLGDPFRGTVERRVRAPGETAVDIELVAARGALGALSLTSDDVDLLLSSSFVGDRLGVGDAAFLARALGLRTPAINFESACSGSVIGLQMAASLVRSGDYRRVLVVASASNSAYSVDEDSLGWFTGDGAGAFVIEAAVDGRGVLGWKTINTVETNDMFVIRSIPAGDGTRLRGFASREAAAVARDTAEPYLRACVDGALSMASLGVADVDFWIFNTPNAWYAAFCADVLGVGRERYHDIYARYANIGAALMPATLYHALHERRVRPGDVVGLYSVGSTSTASAVVLRVGEIALGPYPARPTVPSEVA